MTTTQETRREWIEVTKTKLDEMDEALTSLEKRASNARDQAADQLDTRIQATRRSLTAAQERWAGVKNSTAEAWDGVSQEVSTAWDANRVALERSIEEIRSAVERVTA